MSAAVDPIAEMMRAEEARRHLLPFAKRVYPGFETPPHVAYIGERLEDLESGAIGNLAVSVAVRHGKSVICSQAFPAFCIGRHPEWGIAIVSHSESLAVTQTRMVKQLVEDERYPFDVAIAADSSSNQRFHVVSKTRRAGGFVYGIGTGGSITGRGFSLVVIDDPLHDALSQAERDNAWKWFQEVLVPRLEPGGRIVIVAARLAEDDLTGRVLESEDRASWTHIRLPALSEGEDVDLLRRPIDEPLWPERMDRAELERRRVAMGTRAFSSQFQQNPVPEGGALLEARWLDNRYDALPEGMLDQTPVPVSMYADPVQALVNREMRRPDTRPLPCIQAVDSASSTSPRADRTAIATVASDGAVAFIIDVVSGRFGYGDLKKFVAEQFLKHRSRVSRVYIERASSGWSLLDELKGSSIPVVAVDANEGKQLRIERTLPLWESGKIKLPRHAVWMEDFLAEALRYPGGRHDDLLDAVCTAVVRLGELLQREQHHRRFDRGLEIFSHDWFAR